MITTCNVQNVDDKTATDRAVFAQFLPSGLLDDFGQKSSYQKNQQKNSIKIRGNKSHGTPKNLG